jgi:hypothetical protein
MIRILQTIFGRRLSRRILIKISRTAYAIHEKFHLWSLGKKALLEFVGIVQKHFCASSPSRILRKSVQLFRPCCYVKAGKHYLHTRRLITKISKKVMNNVIFVAA